VGECPHLSGARGVGPLLRDDPFSPVHGHGQIDLAYKALSLPDLAGNYSLSSGFACELLFAALQQGSEGA
jgi:hypothetical protein